LDTVDIYTHSGLVAREPFANQDIDQLKSCEQVVPPIGIPYLAIAEPNFELGRLIETVYCYIIAT
jgi:hypothetical protein